MPELITCRTPGGEVASPGLPTPVPGLYVVEDLTGTAGGTAYAVVHKSGIALGSGFGDPESALAAAVDAGGVLDWHVSAALVSQRLSSDPLASKAVRGIVARWGGNCYGRGPTDDDLRKLEAVT